MKLGLLNKETWIFFTAIRDYLATQYPTSTYTPPTYTLPLLDQQIGHRLRKQQLRRFLRQCDVALFEWASELVVEASQMNLPTKLVVRLHRYEMFQWVDRIRWENIDYVILDTVAMRNKLLARTNLPPKRAVVIRPMPIDPQRIITETRPFAGKIGTLCNLIPRKRVYELILAFDGLRQHLPNLELHIGGPPRQQNQAYYESLLYLIEQLGLQERVVLPGRVENRWAWYQTLDIFITNSYSEGMQVAPIEAAASGCYILSHQWEGAEEIFPAGQRYLSQAQLIHQAQTYIQASPAEKTILRQPTLTFIQQECQQSLINQKIQALLEKAHHAT